LRGRDGTKGMQGMKVAPDCGERNAMARRKTGASGRLVATLALIVLGSGALATTSAAKVSSNPDLRPLCPGPYPYASPQHFSRHIRHLDSRYADSHSPMPHDDAQALLKAAWKKEFARCHGKPIGRRRLRYRVRGNMNQIQDDSAFIPG